MIVYVADILTISVHVCYKSDE